MDISSTLTLYCFQPFERTFSNHEPIGQFVGNLPPSRDPLHCGLPTEDTN